MSTHSAFMQVSQRI